MKSSKIYQLKGIVFVMFLIFSSNLFTGCNKEAFVSEDEIQPIMSFENIKVKVLEDRLYFENRADYAFAIEKLSNFEEGSFDLFEKSIGFQSMRSLLNQKEREAINIEDELLATLLNPQGIIQIAENIFEIDALNETVTVYPASETREKKNGSQIFSTNDDVFDRLDGIETLFTKSSCPSYKEKIENWAVWGGNVECKVVYQKAGIYFSLQSKIKKNFWGGSAYIELSCPSGSSYTQNRRGASQLSIPDNSQGGWDRVYNYRPYSSMRGLRQYYFSVTFYCDDSVSGYPPYSTTLTINCN